jgi:hypothetical protein
VTQILTAIWYRIHIKDYEVLMRVVENRTMDSERALYGSKDVSVRHCRFDGPADGESALKESSGVAVADSYFNLRYPFWHVDGLTISTSEMTDKCRAAIWYSKDIKISDTKLHGIKALRECGVVTVQGCDILSPEFGWSTRGIVMRDTTAESEYFMLRSSHLRFENVRLTGKYSFQYIEDAEFINCHFDTKDAFWHGKRITVRDSEIDGEYLAWYAEDLTLIHCRIRGTQPFCYCKNLRLIDCELLDADLAFERSAVEATLTAPILSVKNPLSGRITAPAVGEIIRDIPEAQGEVIIAPRA